MNKKITGPAHQRRREQGNERTEEILAEIERFFTAEGYIPTRTAIAGRLGLSRATVERHVNRLVEDGRLEQPDGPHTLRLAE